MRRLLAVVPDTVRGRRDRAILLTLLLTVRRRAEVMNLRVADLTLEGPTAYHTYRGKGGKTLDGRPAARRHHSHPAERFRHQGVARQQVIAMANVKAAFDASRCRGGLALG